MNGNYWIKLYHKIITDAKMIRMDDHLWRRTIELFLLAGISNQGGVLPPVEDIALFLYTQPSDILDVIDRLVELGTVHIEGNLPVVTNFKTRQGPSPSVERVRKHRARQREKASFSDLEN